MPLKENLKAFVQEYNPISIQRIKRSLIGGVGAVGLSLLVACGNTDQSPNVQISPSRQPRTTLLPDKSTPESQVVGFFTNLKPDETVTNPLTIRCEISGLTPDQQLWVLNRLITSYISYPTHAVIDPDHKGVLKDGNQECAATMNLGTPGGKFRLELVYAGKMGNDLFGKYPINGDYSRGFDITALPADTNSIAGIEVSEKK